MITAAVPEATAAAQASAGTASATMAVDQQQQEEQQQQQQGELRTLLAGRLTCLAIRNIGLHPHKALHQD